MMTATGMWARSVRHRRAARRRRVAEHEWCPYQKLHPRRDERNVRKRSPQVTWTRRAIPAARVRPCSWAGSKTRVALPIYCPLGAPRTGTRRQSATQGESENRAIFVG